jgi:hypothetical protein
MRRQGVLRDAKEAREFTSGYAVRLMRDERAKCLKTSWLRQGSQGKNGCLVVHCIGLGGCT